MLAQSRISKQISQEHAKIRESVEGANKFVAHPGLNDSLAPTTNRLGGAAEQIRHLALSNAEFLSVLGDGFMAEQSQVLSQSSTNRLSACLADGYFAAASALIARHVVDMELMKHALVLHLGDVFDGRGPNFIGSANIAVPRGRSIHRFLLKLGR